MNRHKLDTSKNIFRVIEVGATMFAWIKEYQYMCFVGDNIEAAHEVAKIQNIVQDSIDYKVMNVALKFTGNKQHAM